MLEKIGHIKNPLTVIAMFAGIAEVSGTIVLPMLNEEVQFLYVWFLMIFPCLLVALFFVTLWVKHTVLYAPSDFQKDESFMQAHFRNRSYGDAGTGFSETQAEFEVPDIEPVNTQDQAAEDQPMVPDLFDNASESVESGSDEKRKKRILDISKRRVLSTLSRLNHGAYFQDVEPKQLPNVKFDGVVESVFSFSAVGFVLLDDDKSDVVATDAYSKMIEARLFWNTLSDDEKMKFSLHIAFMRIKSDHPVSQRILKKIKLMKTKFPFKIDMAEYICDWTELDTKYIND